MKNKWLALVAAFGLTVYIVIDSVWYRLVVDTIIAIVLLTFVTAYPLRVAITALLRRRKKSVEDKVPLSRLRIYMLYVSLGFWLLVLGLFICPPVSLYLVTLLISFFGWLTFYSVVTSPTVIGFLLMWLLAYFLLSAITVLIFYQLIIRFKESRGKTLVFDLGMIFMIIVVGYLWNKSIGSENPVLEELVGKKLAYSAAFNRDIDPVDDSLSMGNVAPGEKKSDGVFVVARPIDHRYRNIDEERSFRCIIYDVVYSCDDKAIRIGDRILNYDCLKQSSGCGTKNLQGRLFPGRVFLDRATSKTYSLMFPYDETTSGSQPDVDINDQMTVYSGHKIFGAIRDSFPVDVLDKDDFREALEEFKQQEIKRRDSGTTAAAVNGG